MSSTETPQSNHVPIIQGFEALTQRLRTEFAYDEEERKRQVSLLEATLGRTQRLKETLNIRNGIIRERDEEINRPRIEGGRREERLRAADKLVHDALQEVQRLGMIASNSEKRFADLEEEKRVLRNQLAYMEERERNLEQQTVMATLERQLALDARLDLKILSECPFLHCYLAFAHLFH